VSENRADKAARISSAVIMSVRRQPCRACSGICSMNRSWYPQSSQNRSSGAASRSLTPHEHRVHLDRRQPGGGRSGQAGQRVSQAVAPGERHERLGREGIHGYVDPVQPGVA
jgi:hypothetical protein